MTKIHRKWLACLTVFGVIAGYCAKAETLAVEGYELGSDMRFNCIIVNDAQTVYNYNEAKSDGLLNIRRSERSKAFESIHSGVFAHILDFTVNRGGGQHGGLCEFTGGKYHIPINRDIWMTAYLQPLEVPPEIYFVAGIIFGFTGDDGRISYGSRRLPAPAVTPDGWLVFQGNLLDLVKDFKNPFLTGYMIQACSQRSFSGQRIVIAVDDISFSTDKPQIQVQADGKIKMHSIVKNDPFVVNYRSLFDELPEPRVNLLSNGSFELGMTGFVTTVQHDTEHETKAQLPDPDMTFAIVESPDAPHGKSVFRIQRQGKANLAILRTRPMPVKEGNNYVFSFYANAAAPCKIKVNGRPIELTPGWKRYTMAFDKVPLFNYQGRRAPGRMFLEISQFGDVDIDFDALQFQLAPLTDYTGQGIAAITACPTAKFGIFAENAPLNFKVTAYNERGETVDAVVEWELQDMYKQKFDSGKRTLRLNPEQGESFGISVPAGRNYARLFCKLQAPGQPIQTFVTAAAALPDMTGITGNQFFGACPVEGSNPPNLKYTLELLQRLGCYSNVVYGLNFHWVADKWKNMPGFFKNIDDVLAFHDQYGIKVILQDELVDPNVEPAPLSEAAAKNITEYCQYKAERYRGRLMANNIFGEYLRKPFENRTAEAAKVIAAAAKGFKAGDPATPLWAPGQDHMDNILDTFALLIRHGAAANVDALTIHPYRIAWNMANHDNMDELVKLVKPTGKPLAGTEGGTPALDTMYWDDICGESEVYTTYFTELQQALMDIRMNAMMLGSGAFIHQATFYPYHGEMIFRWPYHYLNPYNGLSPRPGLPAYAQSVKRLSGAIPIREIGDRHADGLTGYLFRKENRPLAVVWRYDEHHQAGKCAIPLESQLLRAFDLVGEPLPVRSIKGGAELEIGEAPVYLYPSESCDTDAFEAAVGKIRLCGPRLTLAPALGGIGIVIRNDADGPVRGTVESADLAISTKIDLRPASEWKFLAKQLPPSVKPLSGRLKTADRNYDSKAIRAVVCRKVMRKPVFDGTLGAFSGAVFYSPDPAADRSLCLRSDTNSHWNGPADLSGKLALMYDSTHLYVGAEVLDDKYAVPHDDPAMNWANDALQLQFVMSGNLDNASESNILELAVSEKGVTYVCGGPGGKINNAQVKVARIAGKTVYEAAIPWSALKAGFVPGRSPAPGFNFAFCDNDGKVQTNHLAILKGYEKALQAVPGIADQKSTVNDAFLIFQ